MVDTDFTSSYVLTDAILEAALANDPRAAAIALAAASAASQQWYCQRATKAIDAIQYQGYQYLSTQTRQFPRKYRPSDYASPWGATPSVDAYGYVYVSSDVPQDVIDACIEEAVALYDQYTDADSTTRKKLQKAKVVNYSLGGGYSETFGAGTPQESMGLASQEAYALLEKYISRNSSIV